MTSHLSSCPHHSNLRHSHVNLDLVSERCSHDPGFAESHAGELSRSGCQGGVKGSYNKDFRDDHSATARLRVAKGSREESESGRKHHLPKALSGPKEWNTVTQPWTAPTKTQKARDSVPQVLPFQLREELKRESGDWETWKISLKGLYKLMDEVKFKPDWTFYAFLNRKQRRPDLLKTK